MDDLAELAALIDQRNATGRKITAIVKRPPLLGHIGEFVASRIFDIELVESGTNKAIDGFFRCAPLEGRSVNVKWVARIEGILDITPNLLPDYYLVLAGPRTNSPEGKDPSRPWTIESVFLFEAKPLVMRLQERGVNIGVATSVRRSEWDAAQIYPAKPTTSFPISLEQERWLRAFSASGQKARYPHPDRSNFVPDQHRADPLLPEGDLGSLELILPDGRQCVAETWYREGMTLVTFFFSAIDLEDATPAELIALLQSELRAFEVPDEEQRPDPGSVRRIRDASGVEMYSLTFVIGQEF